MGHLSQIETLSEKMRGTGIPDYLYDDGFPYKDYHMLGLYGALPNLNILQINPPSDIGASSLL